MQRKREAIPQIRRRPCGAVFDVFILGAMGGAVPLSITSITSITAARRLGGTFADAYAERAAGDSIAYFGQLCDEPRGGVGIEGSQREE